jgi:hypothetical protein
LSGPSQIEQTGRRAKPVRGLGRHEGTVGGEAGEQGIVRADHGLAHDRVDAVGAHDDVEALRRAIVELDVALHARRDHAPAEHDVLARDLRGDRVEQVRAVHGQIRRAVALLALGPVAL